MIGAFNTAVQALGGFFSKLFWFGTFLPTALFAALHTGLAVLAFGGARQVVPSEIGADGWWATGIVGLVVLAFAIAPLLPLLRGLLDGSILPASVRTYLVTRRIPAVHRRRAEINKVRQETGETLRTCRGAYERLRAAYKQGEKLPNATDNTTVQNAEDAIREVERTLSKGVALTAPDVEKVVRATESALSRNNPNLVIKAGKPSAPSGAEIKLSSRTSKAGDTLDELLTNAEREVQARFDAAVLSLRGVPLDTAVEPNRMGDARVAAQSYPERTYGVDFNYLWPRLLPLVRKEDSAVADHIITAQAQLDFAVISVFYSISLLVWIPALIVFGRSVPLFLLVAAGSPLIVWLSWRLAVESQFGIGVVLKVAVDRYRLDVLRDLRQPTPTSRGAEVELWGRLREAEYDHRLAELLYVPPDKVA